MSEYIYCAVNKSGEIQWVIGSSTKTRYYMTPTYISKAIVWHNEYHTEDQWRLAKFKLVEVDLEEGE